MRVRANNARMNTARIALTLALGAALALGGAAVSRALPADAENAAQALVDSPRHCEWATIERAEGAPIKAWVVYPERADKAPVVIVIHEIFGLTDWIRAVADALAAEGFIAVAPDLLSGMGPGGGGTESFAGDAVREAIRGLTHEETARRLDDVRAWALALPAAGERCAALGFCWGGSAAFAYAAAQPELDASVVYYGAAPTDEDALRRIACPVLGLYGGDDARVTSTVDATASVMDEAGLTFLRMVYDGAGHGFLRQQTGRDGANQRAAEAAWVETTLFLKEHLE